MTSTFETLQAFLQTNWGWAAGLAASMLALTLLAGSLLNPGRKDDIALWLMGAQSEETWARSFTALFDAVFGERHLSLRCFIRSAVASLVAVAAIWLMMVNADAIGPRLQSDLSLGSVLVLALAVNVIADYVSLLETRLLLGRIDRFRGVLAQAAILLLDLVLSAAIIWIAIFAYLRSPLHEGEIESFAEILGLFSIFSVLFYSTFLTSVWTWAYILSTWLVRAFTRLSLAHWLDVENKPVRILGYALALVVFLGALASASVVRRDGDGIRAADRIICALFEGRVCVDVARISEMEAAIWSLLISSCASDASCVEVEIDRFGIDLKILATSLESDCDAGDSLSCQDLTMLYRRGVLSGMSTGKMMQHLRKTCEGGVIASCADLSVMYWDQTTENYDPVVAASYFLKACDDDFPAACSAVGVAFMTGVGLERDPDQAWHFLELACDGGDGRGCFFLGKLSLRKIPETFSVMDTTRLFERGCDLGFPDSCEWFLGFSED